MNSTTVNFNKIVNKAEPTVRIGRHSKFTGLGLKTAGTLTWPNIGGLSFSALAMGSTADNIESDCFVLVGIRCYTSRVVGRLILKWI
jgi:hypothetical protein